MKFTRLPDASFSVRAPVRSETSPTLAFIARIGPDPTRALRRLLTRDVGCCERRILVVGRELLIDCGPQNRPTVGVGSAPDGCVVTSIHPGVDSALLQPVVSGDRGCWSFVDGVDDLGVVDAAQVDGGDREIGTKLALDY